ncbi:MAG: hypothetical protein IT441_09470, partial [Phycisphaeraceae bacterium]|nr:hypothetical protein [Phycisphaeraceae bacterium]
AVMVISSVIAVVGILGAAYFHWLNRAAADRAAAMYAGVVRVLNNKYYVDELYQAMIVTPLRGLGGLFYLVDRMIIDGLVAGVGMLPRLLGLGAATTQRGVLQGYGLGMAAGAALIALLVILAG